MTRSRRTFRRVDRPRSLRAATWLACATMILPSARSLSRAAEIETGEDAVILEERLDVEIVSETLARVHYSNSTKVLTSKGVDKHAVASIFYNPTVTIHGFHAAITSPQGKRSEVKKQQFFDGSAFEAFELYADSKHRSVSFPGLVPGSTLEYE